MTLVSAPSLAVVTTNVAMVEAPLAGSLGVSGRSRAPCQPGMGMERKSEITCDVKALKFQGCYHCIMLPVLTNIPPFPGTDRVPVMSLRKRYKDETYRVAQ